MPELLNHVWGVDDLYDEGAQDGWSKDGKDCGQDLEESDSGELLEGASWGGKRRSGAAKKCAGGMTTNEIQGLVGGPGIEEVCAKVDKEERRTEGGVALPSGLFEKWAKEDAVEAERRYARFEKYKQAGERQQEERRAGQKERKKEVVRWRQETVPYAPKIDSEEAEATPNKEEATEKSAEEVYETTKRQMQLEEGGRRRRARGRRQRGEQQSEVVTVNSSGMPQIIAAVKHAASHKGVVAAILCQEHHRREEGLVDTQAAIRALGWKTTGVAAVTRAGGGASAGVAAITPAHVPSGAQECIPVDGAPKGSEGRLVSVWVQKVVPCGVLVQSAYFHTNEGPSPRNVQLLTRALELAKASGGPWVLGADFNDGPKEVGRWAEEIIKKAGGVIYHTEEPTAFPSGGQPRAVDFFIISEALAPFFAGIRACSEIAVSPHRAAARRFKGKAKLVMQWVVRGPKRFPRQKPIGCPRQPIAPPKCLVEAIGDAANEEGIKKGTSRAWEGIAVAVDAELCGVTDRWSDDGPDTRWCGRHKRPRIVQEPLLPARSSGVWGKLDMLCHSLQWAVNRFEELARLASIAERGVNQGGGEGDTGAGLTEAQAMQWQKLIRKVASPSAPIAVFTIKDDRWCDVVATTQRYETTPAAAKNFFTISAGWARALLVRKKKTFAEERRKGWKNWVKEQMRKGGGEGSTPSPSAPVSKSRGQWKCAACSRRHLRTY